MGYNNRGKKLSFIAFATNCKELTKTNQCRLQGIKTKYGMKQFKKCKKFSCPRLNEFLKQGGIKRTKYKNRFEKEALP